MADVTSQDVQDMLEEFANTLGITIDELLTGYLDLETYAVDKQAIMDRFAAIDVIDSEDGIDSLAEKINSINEVISNSDGEIQGILDLITANNTAISDEATRAAGVESGLRSDLDAAVNKGNSNATAISDLSTVVGDNKTAIEGTVSALDDRVVSAEEYITTLQSDDTVEGSLAKMKADEIVRTAAVTDPIKALGEANEAAIAVLNGDAETDGSVAKAVKDATGGDISDLKGRTEVLEATINDTTDEDDNIVKGLSTRMNDAENATSALDTKVTDLNAAAVARLDDLDTFRAGLASGIITGVKATNVFRAHFGLGEIDENGDATTA